MNPNMQLILQALARRNLGGGVNAGTSAPAITQVTPGAPMQTAPPAPIGNVGQAPNMVGRGNAPSPINSALSAGQKAQGAQFDPETRDLAKSLISRLLRAV